MNLCTEPETIADVGGAPAAATTVGVASVVLVDLARSGVRDG
jgi:hypothetical protein